MFIWHKSEEVSYFFHNSFHTWNILYEIKSLKLQENVRILEMNMTRITCPFGMSCIPANWGSLPFICTRHHKKGHSGLQVTEHGTCFHETVAIDTWLMPSDGSALRCCRTVMSFKKYTAICFKNYVLVLLWDNRSTLCFFLEWRRLWHKLSQAPKQLVKKFHLLHEGCAPFFFVRRRTVGKDPYCGGFCCLSDALAWVHRSLGRGT